jgi:hypothetical protein
MVNRIKNSWSEYNFLVPVAGLFGVIYINPKWFFILIGFLAKQTWLPPDVGTFLEKSPHEVMDQFISPTRGIVLIFSMALLLVLLWKDVDWSELQTIQWPSWPKAVLGFLVLSLFFLPTTLYSMANEYADTTLTLFQKIQPINGETRFLLPALAHILFFRGPVFYHIFALICTLLLVYCLLLWFARNNISLPFWELISLGTINFVAYQFFNPGFPDVLAHIFTLLALTLPIKEKGWLILFAFAMATHEASVFVWTVLTLFLLSRRAWVKFGMVLGMYIFLRFASSGFDASATFAPNMVSGLTSLQWVVAHPDLELAGIFFAFKAGWAIIVMAMIGWVRNRRWKDFLFSICLIAAAVVMTLEGIDTARLAGWAFPVLLFSWKFLAEDENAIHQKVFRFFKVINLLVPTYTVGLNIFLIPAGLYKTVAGWFF